MILSRVHMTGFEGVFDIRIKNTRIASVSKHPIATNNELRLTFDNALAFPGLINSHDHLDFNLFPQFGYRTYANYVEWGNYIHTQYKDEINSVLNIPAALRVMWGIYKNLICGVTTVVDHGMQHPVTNPLISIVNRCQNLHSVQLEKIWRAKLNNLFKKKIPVVIHVGEGNDEMAGREIDELIRWNILKRSIVAVHGVAMSADQARHFRALVWCPETNFYLLKKTAPVNKLKGNTDILFGTDSTLTGNWNIWDHIKLAQKTALLNDEDIYRSLTLTPATVWKLNAGKIAPYKDADVVIVRSGGRAARSNVFFETNPEQILLVMHQGNIRLFDEELLNQLKHTDLNEFTKIQVNGYYKYIQGDLQTLISEIIRYCPGASFPIAAVQSPGV